MSALLAFFREHAFPIQIILVIIAATLLSYQISRPLVDWDEATYAKVVVDTLKSGDISTLQLSGKDWIDKPPLYFWMAMGSVKIFGPQEFAFRIPIVILSLLCLWLVYRIVKELTDEDLTATLAFLVLLSSGLFLIFAREARTDQGVILGILAALFFCIKGWKNPKYLLWLFPSIAIGFLFKSVVVFLAFPAIAIYSLFYGQWSWVRSRYLWIGFLISLALVIPWHVLETVRFRWLFWDRYFGSLIFQKVVANVAGTKDSLNYFELLPFYKPWALVLIIETLIVGCVSFSKHLRAEINIRYLVPPLLIAILIISLFSMAGTHLTTYLLPALPFLAIYIALSYRYLLALVKNNVAQVCAILISVLFVGLYVPNSISSALNQVPGPTFDERSIGLILKDNLNGLPYIVDWPMLETIPYYGNTQLIHLDSKYDAGRLIKAPFYLIINANDESFFYRDPQTPLYSGLSISFKGEYLTMLHGDHDLLFPPFR